MTIQDAYKVLGLSDDVTNEEVMKSYRKKALELHPDRQSSDVEEFMKIVEAKDAILFKKNELDAVSKVLKTVTENYKKMELGKTRLVERRNREIKKINNRFIQKSISRIAPFVAILFIINSFKDIQPALENVFNNTRFSNAFTAEFMLLFNLIILMMTIVMIFFSLTTLLRSRNKEIDVVDDEYDKQLEKLMSTE